MKEVTSSSLHIKDLWNFNRQLPYCLNNSDKESSQPYHIGDMDDRGFRVRFPEGAGNFSLHHRVQNGSGAHPASYPMGIRGSFPGGKAAGA
jgi:hypothetical protein